MYVCSRARYRRIDLHKQFGGQGQGGISTPTKVPLILLFTGEVGEQYYGGPKSQDSFRAKIR
ncbi:MAG TPA: hypothetical protein VEP90_05760 [Methylomirabilota bacterium]|nr:hypothetical protein [Methylomirabilota bacterium]